MNEIQLNSYQCAEIALYMYKEYLKFINEPQVSIPSFQDWLTQIINKS